LPGALTLLGLRSRFRPQKVKKMVTSSPMAAAPLAMMKAAIALSKSPLKRIMVLLSVLTLTSFRYGQDIGGQAAASVSTSAETSAAAGRGSIFSLRTEKYIANGR